MGPSLNCYELPGMHNNACFGAGPAQNVKIWHFVSCAADGPQRHPIGLG
jgi:hypothetical protein